MSGRCCVGWLALVCALGCGGPGGGDELSTGDADDVGLCTIGPDFKDERLCGLGYESCCSPISDAVAIGSGEGFSCAMRSPQTGDVWCWGNNDDGQLGDGTTDSRAGATTPVRDDMGYLRSPTALAVGQKHACLVWAGRPLCWGSNEDGQIGAGQVGGLMTSAVEVTEQVPDTLPVELGPPHAKFEAIAAGGRHTCGVADDGRVFCWGANDSGQLGLGVASSGAVPHITGPVVWEDGSVLADAVQVVAGNNHSCALRSSGEVACWGNGQDGQIATYGNQSSAAAAPADLWGRASDISAGANHTCVVLPQAVYGDGSTETDVVHCWGDNVALQLGRSNYGPTNGIPGRSAERTDGFVAVAAGGLHTCALNRDGEAYCWGFALSGLLGPDSGTPHDSNLNAVGPLYDGEKFVELEAGWGHTCGRTPGGTVRCWGQGDAGQLGDGSFRDSNDTSLSTVVGLQEKLDLDVEDE